MLDQESAKILTLTFIYILLFTVEQLRPYFKNRKHHTRHTLRNLSIALVNATLSSVILVTVIEHLCQWTYDNNIGFLNQIETHAFITILAAILIMDCWQYAWHRANHVIPFLWKFHQVHHSDKDMDASTGLRFHPVEIIISHTMRLALIPLAGLQLEHLIIYEFISLPIILFHHSNIRLDETVDKVLRVLLVTPHMHRLHHSEIRTETDSNYSSILSVWDRLFKSFTMRPIENNINLGLGDIYSTDEWNRLSGILKIPFTGK